MQRIVIWDNGEEYSDHCITFMRVVEPFDEARFLRDMMVLAGGGYIVAVVSAAEVDWRGDGLDDYVPGAADPCAYCGEARGAARHYKPVKGWGGDRHPFVEGA